MPNDAPRPALASQKLKLNPQAGKVLQFLADEFSEESGYFSFAGIMSGAGINDRAAVRRACRLLARKGFASFERSLWDDDGEPRGAGYGATRAGVEAIYGRQLRADVEEREPSITPQKEQRGSQENN